MGLVYLFTYAGAGRWERGVVQHIEWVFPSLSLDHALVLFLSLSAIVHGRDRESLSSVRYTLDIKLRLLQEETISDARRCLLCAHTHPSPFQAVCGSRGRVYFLPPVSSVSLSLSLCFSLCLSLYVSLPMSLSVRLCVRLCVCLYVCLSLYLARSLARSAVSVSCFLYLF